MRCDHLIFCKSKAFKTMSLSNHHLALFCNYQKPAASGRQLQVGVCFRVINQPRDFKRAVAQSLLRCIEVYVPTGFRAQGARTLPPGTDCSNRSVPTRLKRFTKFFNRKTSLRGLRDKTFCINQHPDGLVKPVHLKLGENRFRDLPSARFNCFECLPDVAFLPRIYPYT